MAMAKVNGNDKSQWQKSMAITKVNNNRCFLFFELIF